MVDAASRRIAAGLVRQLVSGRITNDVFEDRWPRSADPAVSEIREAAWFLYSDLREYRLSGAERLVPPIRTQVARWVLFLHGDLMYEWPAASPLQKLARQVANVLTLGVASRSWAGRMGTSGDVDVWPYFRRRDFRAALRRPRLLRRGRR